MKKILTIMLIGLGLFLSSAIAQPNPVEKTLTLTTGFTTTDSTLIPGGLIPVSVRVLNVTNSSTAAPLLGFGNSPMVFWPILILGGSSDYSVDIADTSISVFDANQMQSAMAKSNEELWLKLEVDTAEATDIQFIVRFRYF